MQKPKRNEIPFFLAGAALGAMLAVFYDPSSGRGRRAKIRARSLRMARHAMRVAGRATRHWMHRGQGVMHEFAGGQAQVEVDDVTLLARVRSELGHIVRHLSSLRIEADHGVITLNGAVSSVQARDILSCVGNLPGIRGLRNQLTVQDYMDA